MISFVARLMEKLYICGQKQTNDEEIIVFLYHMEPDNGHGEWPTEVRRCQYALRSCADGESAAVAGYGNVCLHPLFAEHIYRPGVGFRR
jgi:hypothetical protein